jgi:hypothetical protein
LGKLGAKLAMTRSATEAFEGYAECVMQQIKMSADDAHRLLSDFQYVTQKLTQSLLFSAS